MKVSHRLAPLFFSLFLLAAACSKKEIPEEAARPAVNELAAESAVPAWTSLALLRAGKNPLWFELGTAGPALIESPAAASLAPYVPWPHSRFAAGIEAWGDSLVMAINRDGFLAAVPAEGQNGMMLYRAADPERWEPYTIASFFFYDNKPAALLYRDDFFVSTEVPMPERQVFVLREDAPAPEAVSAPALEILPKAEGWEVNSLRRGPDGNWYYRFSQTGYPQPGTLHYRAGNLFLEGERVSLADYRDSSKPENAAAGPSFVNEILTRAEAYFPGLNGIPVMRVLSPEFSGSRLFSANPNGEENFTPLFGYCRNLALGTGTAELSPENAETSPGQELRAFAITPDGQGIASRGGAFFAFSLPSLPDGFVYTGAGLAGNVLIAVWEEQEDSLIGAAGFMAVDAEMPELYHPVH